MATNLSDAIEAILEADATLGAILTGGIYAVRNDDKAPINETDTPSAYGTIANSGGVKELKPCAVIRPWGSPVTFGPRGMGQREWFLIGVYDVDGYVNTQAALVRIRELLHDTIIQLDNGRNYECDHVDTPRRAGTEPEIWTGAERPASYEAARYICSGA